MNSTFLRASRYRFATVATATAIMLLTSGCAGGDAGANLEGVWGDPAAEGKPSLEFFADGSYTGTDGCNRVNGDYTETKDGTVDLGLMRATMMFCEGVDTWLMLAQEAKVTSGELVFRDEKGTEIGTLTRHED